MQQVHRGSRANKGKSDALWELPNGTRFRSPLRAMSDICPRALRWFSFEVPFCGKNSRKHAHLPPGGGLSEKSLSEMSGGDGGMQKYLFKKETL